MACVIFFNRILIFEGSCDTTCDTGFASALPRNYEEGALLKKERKNNNIKPEVHLKIRKKN